MTCIHVYLAVQSETVSTLDFHYSLSLQAALLLMRVSDLQKIHVSLNLSDGYFVFVSDKALITIATAVPICSVIHVWPRPWLVNCLLDLYKTSIESVCNVCRWLRLLCHHFIYIYPVSVLAFVPFPISYPFCLSVRLRVCMWPSKTPGSTLLLYRNSISVGHLSGEQIKRDMAW